MNLSSKLKRIHSVSESNRVNIFIVFNDGFNLLVEGSFRARMESDLQFTSKEYVDSNFDPEYLKKINTLLEHQHIRQAVATSDTGSLKLELESGLEFESFFGESDHETWTLADSRGTIYGSECGGIIHY